MMKVFCIYGRDGKLLFAKDLEPSVGVREPIEVITCIYSQPAREVV